MADRRRLRRAARARWASCRTSSSTTTPGTSTASSSRRWTRCAARRRTPTSTVLSGGEKRRVALCRLLLAAARPAAARRAHQPPRRRERRCGWSSTWRSTPGTVVAVTHDRYFLDNVAQWILELDRGRAYPYEGNYSTYLETKAARIKVEGAEGRQARASAWTRSWSGCGPAPRARQAKSKARLARYEEMAAEADQYRKLDFEEIQIPPGPRLGSLVVEADKLTKGFDDRVLIDGPVVHAAAQRHRRRHRPERRRQDHAVQDDRRRGAARRRRRSRSARPSRSPTSTRAAAASTRTRRVGGRLRRPRPHQGRQRRDALSRAYVAAFGFKGPDQQKPAGVLSGGERNRLNLALTLKQGGNLLLLDEPTNDLDVETLALAGERAAGVPRLRRGHHPRPVVPRPGRDAHPGLRGRASSWFWFEGNFEAYEKNKIDRLGAEAARPHRATYRKLTRG